MDGIVGTVKNLVYRRILSGYLVVNTPWEFTELANQISSVDCLLLDKPEFIQEPEEVSKARPIELTLKVHKVSRVCISPHSFFNHFFKFSEDLEPFHVEKLGDTSMNKINDESLRNNS